MNIPTKPCTSLSDVLNHWHAHAERYYRRRDGSHTREHQNYRAVLDRFEAFAGCACEASKINRHQVRAWLDQLAAEKLTRGYINACLRKLRTVVRWCADHELVPIAVVADLSLVRSLQAFRSPAIEAQPVPAVSLDSVQAVMPFLPRWARDVVQLLMLTAARPGEILAARSGEVHLEPKPALVPVQHKNAHRGHPRVIPLNEKAMTIVERTWRPFLPTSLLFPSLRTGKVMSNTTLGAAIDRAAKRAGVPTFNPNQIRHTSAQRVRKAAGLDAAAALLGHKHVSTTEIYAPTTNNDQARLAAEVLQ
jgi:integrase